MQWCTDNEKHIEDDGVRTISKIILLWYNTLTGDKECRKGLLDLGWGERSCESWQSNIWSSVPRDSEPRMTVLAGTSSNLPDPTGGGGLIKFWTRDFSTFLTHHIRLLFSLCFPLKAEINTIKSLIIKHDCNAKRCKFMRLSHTFLAKIDKCHSLRHALAFSFWRRHNRKQRHPLLSAVGCRAFCCCWRNISWEQVLIISRQDSGYPGKEHILTQCYWHSLQATNDHRFAPISQR
jgi:hypothetical protein